MVMTVFVISGYWRTGKLISARNPTNKISSETTIERTGRRMNRSVKCMARSGPWHGGRLDQAFFSAWDDFRAVGNLGKPADDHTIARGYPAQNGHAAVDIVTDGDGNALGLQF